MSTKFAVLIATVSAFQSVAEGAAHLLGDLHTRLSVAADNDDMDEVRDIVASINASKDELAAAVAANTPADRAAPGNDTITGGGSSSGSGGGSDTSSLSGGDGNDSLAGGNADDSLSGGNAGDSLDTSGAAPPVAVISTDPEVIQQAPGDTAPPAVIVTDHPDTGEVLVTPVTGGDHDQIAPGDVTVDATTGVPTVDPASGVTLGETAPATNQDAATSAADMATATPDAVVSAPAAPSSDE